MFTEMKNLVDDEHAAIETIDFRNYANVRTDLPSRNSLLSRLLRQQGLVQHRVFSLGNCSS